jgi:hypothetical protein
MKYLYSVVRFVPDPARGEFVNVGVIVGSDKAGEWEIRSAENLQRARHLDDPDRRSLAAVTDFVERIENQIDEYSEAVEEGAAVDVPFSEDWLYDLHGRMEHVIQVSRPAPIRADSAHEALARIFEQLVVDPIHERLPYARKTRASAALRWAYRDTESLDLDEHVFEEVTIRSGLHASPMDFAVANGKVVQLAQTWSFQVPDQRRLTERIRAWGWTLEGLKDEGGEVLLNGARRQDVAKGVDLAVVFVPPRDNQADTSAFSDALGVFRKIGAVATPLDEANSVAQRAADLLGETSAAG